MKTVHTKDSDCSLDEHFSCTGCGVQHSEDPCECGGRGFHRPGCANSDERFYTPDTLDDFQRKVEALRVSALLEIDGAGASPMSEQFYLLALNHLESASRFLKLAKYNQSRGD